MPLLSRDQLPSGSRVFGIIEWDDRAGNAVLPSPRPGFSGPAGWHPRHPIGVWEEHFAGARPPLSRGASDHVSIWKPAPIPCLVGAGFVYACSPGDFLSNNAAKNPKSAKVTDTLGLTNTGRDFVNVNPFLLVFFIDFC